MNRDSITGVAVILVLIGGFFLYNYTQFKKDAEQQLDEAAEAARQAPVNETIEALEEAPDDGDITRAADPIALDTSAIELEDSARALQERTSLLAAYGDFASSANGVEQTYTLANDEFEIVFTNKGARPLRAELKDYLRWDKAPLVLFDSTAFDLHAILPLARNQIIRTNELFFKAEQIENGIKFIAPSSSGGRFVIEYRLTDSPYLLDMDIRLVDAAQAIAQNATYLELIVDQRLERQERNLDGQNGERNNSTIVYQARGESAEILKKQKPDQQLLNEKVHWVSHKQTFFNLALINSKGFLSANMATAYDEEDTSYVKNCRSQLTLPFTRSNEEIHSLQLYIGPNDYRILRKMEIGLEDVLQLAPDFWLFSWFSFISKRILIPMFNFLEEYVGNYGLIILLLTVIIKLVLTPLTFRSYKYQVVMKLLKPELERIREKHKDDQQKQGTEQWKLYQRAGVNPLSGCIPMLLQMPILISMYYFFPSSIELRQEAFLWANDLSTFDAVLSFSPVFGIGHISLFTVLMTITSMIYSITNMQSQAATGGNEALKYMPYIFPIFLFFIFNSFPAALSYYYFLFNLGSFLQQWGIKKFVIDEEKIQRELNEKQKKPAKKSKWQQRLEDIQRQQQQQQTTAKNKKGRK